MSHPPDAALLELDRVSVTFARRGGRSVAVQAVRDVSLRIVAGGSLGVVGESGCGKSSLARAALRLAPVSSGRVVLDGVDVTHRTEQSLRPLRRHAQMVFQDPLDSLNPRLTIGSQLADPLIVHRVVRGRAAIAERVAELLRMVELPADFANRHPHQLSGGQRQRVGIARALALHPRLLICDEPTAALDVSIQAQILNLLASLRESFGLTLMMISHNLAVVRQLCDEIVVMYAGRVVESGPTDEVLASPAHPYTALLRGAVLEVETSPPGSPAPARASKSAATESAESEPQDALRVLRECPFQPRCGWAQPRCEAEEPLLRPIGQRSRRTACHFAEQVVAQPCTTLPRATGA